MASDLSRAKPIVKKHFEKHPKASISIMFRRLRNDKRFSGQGAYPIISVIVNTIRELGLEVERRKVFQAFQQSSELRGKRIIIDTLFSTQNEAYESSISAPLKGENLKDDISVVENQKSQKLQSGRR